MGSILTVITPAVTNELTTPDTVKDELGITGAEYDARVIRYIQQASGAIGAYCQNVFGLQTNRERWTRANFDDGLPLRYRPLVEILSLTENGAGVDFSQYYTDADKSMIFKQRSAWCAYPAWRGEVVVEYKSGYELLDGVPYEIERACILLVSQYWHAGGGASGGSRDPYVRSEDIPGVASYSYGFGPQANGAVMPPEVEALLSSYRGFAVA